MKQVRRQTDLKITEIRTNTEFEENKRRHDEEKEKQAREKKISNEVITSHKKNVEIDWNWQELEEKEDCKELAEVSLFIPLLPKYNPNHINLLFVSFFRISRFKSLSAGRFWRTNST